MMTKPRLLLLNPPGKSVYLRDYFCSKVSQADYVNHPVDLVCLSGYLVDSYDLSVIDAIVERLTVRRCLDRVRQLRPDIIVGLIGSVSYPEDVAFYRQVADKVGARIILIGDILIERRQERLQELPFVEAFLHDFASGDLLSYLRGDSRDTLRNITFRVNHGTQLAPIARQRSDTWNLPLPQHQLFMQKNYRYPFVRHRKFATILTEFGCPYSCTFCIMSTLGWKVRPIENLLPEFDLLKGLGVRELFFLDQTFGIQKERAHQLLQEMRRRDYDFGWVCFSRPDIVNETLLAEMKASGCHTIILGLESGNGDILDSVRKDYDIDEVKAGFRLCKEQGLRTVATVLLGLPAETETTFAQTMSLLEEVSPDFASFNVAVPRLGTPFRESVLELKLATRDHEIMDQSGREISLPTMALSREEISKLKKKAIHQFYFNSRYLRQSVRRLAAMEAGRTWDVLIHLRQGFGLLRNYFSI